MPWPPRRRSSNEVELAREITTLQLKLLKVNSALAIKTRYAERLEFLLAARNARIDQLQGQLEQSRQQVQRLDAECEHLADMVRLLPQLDPAMLGAK